MKPLAYLFFRSFFNGVRRAVTNVRRLIALIFFCGYYILILARPGSGGNLSRLSRIEPSFSLPSTTVLESFVFATLGVASLLMLTGLFSYRGSFRPADVDVLFPTPVNPKAVLLFRIFRDYFATLLVPLLVAIIGFRASVGGLELFFKSFPSTGAYALRATSVAYLGMMLSWVVVGYAASMFINRTDLKSDRNRVLMTAGLAIALMSVAFVIGRAFLNGWSIEALVSITHHPVIRFVMLPAWAGSALVMGPLTGNWLEFSAGLVGLIAIIGGGLALAMSQVGYMYDQASARGFDSVSIRSLRQQGDAYAIAAMRAQTKKVSDTWITKRVRRWVPSGAVALLWKEFLLQARAGGVASILPGLAFVTMGGIFVYFVPDRGNPSFMGYVLLYFNGLMAFTLGLASGQSGFIELLRRVDFLKPLPFVPTQTVFWEVTAKIVFPSIWGAVMSLVVTILRPATWQFGIASTLLVVAFTLTLISTILLVVILFPDMEDATQRGFRGLMILLGSAITCAPPLTVLVTLLAFKFSPLVSMVIPVLMCLGISLGVCALAGRFYATFNPSE